MLQCSTEPMVILEVLKVMLHLSGIEIICTVARHQQSVKANMSFLLVS